MWVLYRDAGKVANTAALMQQAGHAPVAAYTADLASLRGIRQLSSDVLKDFAEVDLLVNNAGAYMEA